MWDKRGTLGAIVAWALGSWLSLAFLLSARPVCAEPGFVVGEPQLAMDSPEIPTDADDIVAATAGEDFMLVFVHGGCVRRQRLSVAGQLLGRPMDLACSGAALPAVVFDGTNYVVTWSDDVVNVRFAKLNVQGELVGPITTVATFEENSPVPGGSDSVRMGLAVSDAGTTLAACVRQRIHGPPVFCQTWRLTDQGATPGSYFVPPASAYGLEVALAASLDETLLIVDGVGGPTSYRLDANAKVVQTLIATPSSSCTTDCDYGSIAAVGDDDGWTILWATSQDDSFTHVSHDGTTSSVSLQVPKREYQYPSAALTTESDGQFVSVITDCLGCTSTLRRYSAALEPRGAALPLQLTGSNSAVCLGDVLLATGGGAQLIALSTQTASDPLIVAPGVREEYFVKAAFVAPDTWWAMLGHTSDIYAADVRRYDHDLHFLDAPGLLSEPGEVVSGPSSWAYLTTNSVFEKGPDFEGLRHRFFTLHEADGQVGEPVELGEPQHFQNVPDDQGFRGVVNDAGWLIAWFERQLTADGTTGHNAIISVAQLSPTGTLIGTHAVSPPLDMTLLDRLYFDLSANANGYRVWWLDKRRLMAKDVTNTGVVSDAIDSGITLEGEREIDDLRVRSLHDGYAVAWQTGGRAFVQTLGEPASCKVYEGNLTGFEVLGDTQLVAMVGPYVYPRVNPQWAAVKAIVGSRSRELLRMEVPYAALPQLTPPAQGQVVLSYIRYDFLDQYQSTYARPYLRTIRPAEAPADSGATDADVRACGPESNGGGAGGSDSGVGGNDGTENGTDGSDGGVGGNDKTGNGTDESDSGVGGTDESVGAAGAGNAAADDEPLASGGTAENPAGSGRERADGADSGCGCNLASRSTGSFELAAVSWLLLLARRRLNRGSNVVSGATHLIPKSPNRIG